MNHDRTDPRTLELVTARGLEPGAALDPETSELREGWQALSDVLSRRQIGSDSVFAARLARELATRPTVVRRGYRPRFVVTGALGAVAAAVLVAAGIWVFGKFETRKELAAAGQSHVAPGGKPVVDGSADVDWDDPFDGQIASLEEQFGKLDSEPPGLDASLSALDQKLSELSDDLDACSL